MDTIKMDALLRNYKKILGEGCDSCISQANDEILAKVTGKASFLNHLGFLLNIIDYIENEKNIEVQNIKTEEADPVEKDDIFNGLYKEWFEEVKAENEELKASNNELVKKIESLQSLIDTYNKCYVQQAKLKNGEKIAYKEQASVEEVQALKLAGLTFDQIANKLGVSKSTIWRRLKNQF